MKALFWDIFLVVGWSYMCSVMWPAHPWIGAGIGFSFAGSLVLLSWLFPEKNKNA